MVVVELTYTKSASTGRPRSNSRSEVRKRSTCRPGKGRAKHDATHSQPEPRRKGRNRRKSVEQAGQEMWKQKRIGYNCWGDGLSRGPGTLSANKRKAPPRVTKGHPLPATSRSGPSSRHPMLARSHHFAATRASAATERNQVPPRRRTTPPPPKPGVSRARTGSWPSGFAAADPIAWAFGLKPL
ncbi:hypothetical protein BDY21DRAFT_188912 [Lineolata rhizophorae]|uniref:Uncharacterized protein n=1 Tax=Lineolata rhizophorae TaxID=578093 RepID=A0A6A6P5S3_9PEZI|nr:hypothetical protein BDY21DRAFT_188912 [Lineolata rhizophorae]